MHKNVLIGFYFLMNMKRHIRFYPNISVHFTCDLVRRKITGTAKQAMKIHRPWYWKCMCRVAVFHSERNGLI